MVSSSIREMSQQDCLVSAKTGRRLRPTGLKMVASCCSLILFLLTTTVSAQSRQQQRFEREPEDQTAVVGETVVLACRVLNKGGILQWTKDDFGLGSDRNLSGFERYSMIGSDEEGTYSLQIKPVTLDDDGRFQCQVSPGPDPGSSPIRSRYATLVVNVPPEAPQLVQGRHLVTTEHREVELECHSRAGKPPAEINWLDGAGSIISTGVEVFQETLADGKRTNVKSVLKLSPTKENHNKNITCQAQNAAERIPRVANIHLEVKYAPKVTVALERDKIVEFDSVRLTCLADANPPNVVYKWYINGEVAYGDYTTQLTIASVSRKLNNAIVKCEVYNSVGKSEDTQTLNVHYSPVIRGRPQNVEADMGSSVTLQCDVEGNPTPEVTWTHESSRRILSTGPAYTFWMTSEMVGRFFCTARVAGFPEVSADAMVLLKGAPSVTSKRIQFGLEGDTVRIECTASSIPRPDRVIWTHLGHEVDSGDPRISILEDPLPEGVRSTLVIRESEDRDFGAYNCTVVNAYGTDAAEILLKKQKSLPLLIILAGVIGGIIIIIAVVMVIILCHKRAKKSSGHDKGDKQSKQSDQSSNNDSDLKVDIRTASSLSNPPESDQWDDSSDRITPRPVLGNANALYRYSNDPGDYVDSVFPPKSEGHNNNGYVPYVDYGRDYNPPLSTSRSSLYGVTSPSTATAIPLTAIDPRFSAAYGNPYLRSSTTSLPPPHLSSAAYGSLRSGPAPQAAASGNATPPPGSAQYILNNKAQLKPGTLATHV